MFINSSLMNWIKNAQAALHTIAATAGFLQQEDNDLILQEDLDRIEL